MIEDIVWVMLRISDTKVISYISVFDIESILFYFFFLLGLSFVLAGFEITEGWV